MLPVADTFLCWIHIALHVFFQCIHNCFILYLGFLNFDGLSFLSYIYLPLELPQDASALSKELKEFSLMTEHDSTSHTLPVENLRSVSPVEERFFFQSNTTLDRHKVSFKLCTPRQTEKGKRD